MDKKIIELIAEQLGKDADSITMNSKLVEELGADSLDVVELIMAFEDEFDIVLPDEDIAGFKTVGDVVNYITNLKK